MSLLCNFKNYLKSA